MKNKIKGMIIIISYILFCSVLNTNKVVYAKIMDEKIICYANKVVWRYKIINGVLYKRQYDAATERWIGSWVLA